MTTAMLLAPSDQTLREQVLNVATRAATAKQDTLAGKAGLLLASRSLSALFVQAFLAGDHFKLRAEMQDANPAEWATVKDSYSKAIMLCNTVSAATSPLPVIHMTKARKAITLAGRAVDSISKSDLASLANPELDDSPLSTVLDKTVRPFNDGITLINGLPHDALKNQVGHNAPAKQAKLPDLGPAELVKMSEDAFLDMLATRMEGPEFRAELMAQCRALNDRQAVIDSALGEQFQEVA